MKPYIPLFAVTILALSIFSCRQAAETEAPKRPNIVFIMADDHAYQAISAYDSSLIRTPNIDRIAKIGMLFTNASVTNSICAFESGYNYGLKTKVFRTFGSSWKTWAT